MSGSEYTLTGFSDFLEGRRVTFVDPLPSMRVCGLCDRVPSRSLLLSCGQVLCEPCRNQIKEQEPCPFDGKDCFAGNFVPQDYELAELDEYRILCPNSEDCAFTGTLSTLMEHLVNCSSEKAECPKCSQRVALSVAIDHRRCCSGAAAAGQEASTAVAYSGVIREVQDIMEGLETLIQRVPGDVLDKDYVTEYVNSIVKRITVLERDITKGQQHPVGSSQKRKLSLAMEPPPFALTPCRAASRRNVHVTMCSFDVQGKLESLDYNKSHNITHPPTVLDGYLFRLECVLNREENGESTVRFKFSLGEGKWDGRLIWPFARVVTVILTHPNDSERDIPLPVYLPDHEMVKKPAPGTWNQGNTTGTVSWEHVELNGFVDGGSIYANVELT
ncbi:uncharacterized protein [Dermacentor albipictus]|uniref:uncharacterized protein n=1 Tax=Dermacentor albipictus TaxID=60249 RepID=UPI0031FC05F5